MELYFANWANQEDFECHTDDHGFESLLDMACVSGNLFHSLDEAKEAAEWEYCDRMDVDNDATGRDASEDDGICWVEMIEHHTDTEQAFEAHDRGGNLRMILVIRKFEINEGRIVRPAGYYER